MGKLSEEHKRKISLAHLGRKRPLWMKKIMSEAAKTRKITPLFRKARSDNAKINPNYGMKGKHHSEETRRLIGLKRIGKYSGDKSGSWRGGITPINQKIRGSLEYKLWSDSVWNRDGNSCRRCGENRISRLVAHHILNFSSYVELRFAIDNGITLCKECHREFHKEYGKKNNTKGQIKKFVN